MAACKLTKQIVKIRTPKSKVSRPRNPETFVTFSWESAPLHARFHTRRDVFVCKIIINGPCSSIFHSDGYIVQGLPHAVPDRVRLQEQLTSGWPPRGAGGRALGQGRDGWLCLKMVHTPKGNVKKEDHWISYWCVLRRVAGGCWGLLGWWHY